MEIVTDKKADKRWLVLAKKEIQKDTNVDYLRRIYRPDIVLQQHNILYLCRAIIDAEFQDLPNVDIIV